MSDTPESVRKLADDIEHITVVFHDEEEAREEAFQGLHRYADLLEQGDARIRELEAKVAQLEIDVCPWCKSKEEGMQAFLKREPQR